MAPTFPPFHVQGFNPRSLRMLLSRAGFELDDLVVEGEIWEFTGEKSFRKKVEYSVAKAISWVGRRINKGPYMAAWAKKPVDAAN